MAPTLKRSGSTTEEITLDPDYCYEQAAEVLAGRAPILNPAMYGQSPEGRMPNPGRETFDCWLLLAEALREHAASS